MNDKITISVHIPKTGGTAFRQWLHDIYGDQLYQDYGDIPLANTLKGRLRRAKNHLSAYKFYLRRTLLKKRIKCVHGHFLAKKYDRVFNDTRFVTWFRDPVERVISHYYFWKAQADMKNPWYRKMQKHNWNLIDFAGEPRLRNMQSYFLQNKPFREFEFVGITEEFERSMRLYGAMFSIESNIPLPVSNRNPERKAELYEVPRETKDRIRELNQIDMLLYDEARQRFHELCNQFNISRESIERLGKPLYEGAFRAEISIEDLPAQMNSLALYSVKARVKNVSGIAWTYKKEGRYRINLSCHWLDSEGNTVIHDGIWTPLPTEVSPGQEVELEAEVRAPESPDRYILEFDLVQENVAWFGDKGSSTLRKLIAVLPRPSVLEY
jgi:hypothetical protein